MRASLLKFAILGSTYARALENANTRAGRPAGAFASIAAQPLAKLKPGASVYARAPGALTPTPQQQGVQQFLHKTPWATDEHTGLVGGSDHAVNTFNDMLQESGRSHNTPAGQPPTHQQIQQRWGTPKPSPSASADRPVGGDLFSLMDQNRGNTRIGPAPMPTPPRQIVHTPASTAGTAVLRKAAHFMLPAPMLSLNLLR